jgi:hypothetical protein
MIGGLASLFFVRPFRFLERVLVVLQGREIQNDYFLAVQDIPYI